MKDIYDPYHVHLVMENMKISNAIFDLAEEIDAYPTVHIVTEAKKLIVANKIKLNDYLILFRKSFVEFNNQTKLSFHKIINRNLKNIL